MVTARVRIRVRVAVRVRIRVGVRAAPELEFFEELAPAMHLPRGGF